MRSLIIGLAVIAGLSAPASATQAPGDASACRINGSSSFLRDLLFGAAARIPSADQGTVTELKRASAVELRNARVLSYDAQSGRIECTGDVQLTVPGEAARAFGGKTQLTTPTRFTAEPASDGNGFTIFSSRMLLSADIAAASRILGPTRLSPVAASVAPTPTAAPPVRAADPKPAFDCALASTSVESLICSDSELAERDRRVAQRYFALRGSLPQKPRTLLLASQRLFLKERSQCASSECLSALYDARLHRLDELEVRIAK
jgi:uncharacterized protein YecT (DUF1311 family)